MSLDSVRAFFAKNAPDIHVLVTEASSATVQLAAEAHGVTPAQIAKTICLRAGDTVMLIVASGTARLDNRKFRERFSAKARMLDAAEVVTATGHPVGGVCPFGLPAPLPVYCDVSLKAFDEIVPAAGATNAALRIGPNRLAELTGAEWVDVCQTQLVDREPEIVESIRRGLADVEAGRVVPHAQVIAEARHIIAEAKYAQKK